MIRPHQPDEGERFAKRRAVESSGHEGLKEFIEYMKNLKTMLLSEGALTDEHIPAMCKQLSKHLTPATVPRYVCDQLGSRLIESIFDQLSIRVKETLASSDAAESSPDSVRAAVASILNLFTSIFCAVTDVANIFDIVASQYGSHTVEGLLRFYSNAFVDQEAVTVVGFSAESYLKVTDAFYGMTQCLYCTLEASRNFWTLAKDPRATHVLRAVAKNLTSEKATQHFLDFIEQIWTDESCRRKLHTDLYWNQHSAVTLQTMLTAFAECVKENETTGKSLPKDKLLPEDDGSIQKLLVDKTDTGRRMLEYFIENDYLSNTDFKRLFSLLFALPDLATAVHGSLKPLFHKVLVSKGLSILTNSQMEQLIDCASLTENTRFLRNLIIAARCNKTHARSLIDKLKVLSVAEAGVQVDWEARRNEFAEQKLGKIETTSNFWYMLMTAPRGDSEQASFRYEGCSVASEIISNLKAGHITTELLEELSQFFDKNNYDEVGAHADANAVADADIAPGTCSNFDDLTHCKHGVMFLEKLVRAHLPDGVKRKVRRLAAERIRDLCFDPNGSWLVATVVEEADGKEKTRLFKSLGAIRSELLKRNPALYDRLGPEFRRCINQGQRSIERFGN